MRLFYLLQMGNLAMSSGQALAALCVAQAKAGSWPHVGPDVRPPPPGLHLLKVDSEREQPSDNGCSLDAAGPVVANAAAGQTENMQD